MRTREVDVARRLAALLPELTPREDSSSFEMLPRGDLHRLVHIRDGRHFGTGLRASVIGVTLYLPFTLLTESLSAEAWVGLGQPDRPAQDLEAELVSLFRAEPLTVLRKIGTAFGVVDVLRARGLPRHWSVTFEYAMALARAGVLHEARRRIIEFLSMTGALRHHLIEELIGQAEEMLIAIDGPESKRDELFERWIHLGKMNWGLIEPVEEKDEDENDLGEWRVGDARW